MSKKKLVVNNDSESISGALGITDERAQEIQKETTKIVKEESEKEDKSHSRTISRVWNQFDDDNECAFAMYMLQHAEMEVEVHEFFRLPEVVGSKADA